MFPKTRPWRSKKYRERVAQLPCVVCSRIEPAGNAPHHEHEDETGLAFTEKPMGGKVDDRYCLPLCHGCHTERHQKGAKAVYGYVDIIRVLETVRRRCGAPEWGDV